MSLAEPLPSFTLSDVRIWKEEAVKRWQEPGYIENLQKEVKRESTIKNQVKLFVSSTHKLNEQYHELANPSSSKATSDRIWKNIEDTTKKVLAQRDRLLEVSPLLKVLFANELGIVYYHDKGQLGRSACSFRTALLSDPSNALTPKRLAVCYSGMAMNVVVGQRFSKGSWRRNIVLLRPDMEVVTDEDLKSWKAMQALLSKQEFEITELLRSSDPDIQYALMVLVVYCFNNVG
jgi:hypothetical protein